MDKQEEVSDGENSNASNFISKDSDVQLQEAFDTDTYTETVPRKKNKKPKEPGILYITSVPPFMTVKRIREIFDKIGNVGRIFLQPDERPGPKRGRRGKRFTEGWVEFDDKRRAKRVATTLNNTLIGGRKRSRHHDMLWSLKYLPKFKWGHLSERLAYEKAVHVQRLRTEVAQAKREATAFATNVEKGRQLSAHERRAAARGDAWEERRVDVAQRATDEEVRETRRRRRKGEKAKRKPRGGDGELLRSIFS
ncbi:PREDICTED: activator of basal transcription 1-like [Priapulus caudatus]|uniref:Activator of basal transcription 1 n=1 Tax=Priapulus caudatus TaxID=37621 RepID=A0ABM1EVP2_PRICU|nr:PREDICTED: activator of basal transcription 1-like [Priapulus caudatus]